ncbi:MAG: glycosyltransferase family 2 protein [Acidobacteria bacterium]|nr:MAG: glycosyltransferase family 2 protein [Acidobacteriota bacterium]
MTSVNGAPGREAIAPLVSVIVPAYNAEAFIQATLESVVRQTYRNLEVIVVDDGSTDGTAGIVRSFTARDSRVALLQQANAGVAAARNAAIQAARGPFIAPIDADDLWKPEKIERQVDCFLANGDRLGLVYTWWEHVDEDGFVAPRTDYKGRAKTLAAPRGMVLHHLIEKNIVGNASTPLMRKDYVLEVGAYDPSLRARNAQGCEDWKLYLALAERYEFDVVPEYLVGYRQTRGMMSRNHVVMQRSCELVLHDVRGRHPEIEEAVFRRNVTLFNLWVIARDTSALTPLLAALRRDPRCLLRKSVRNQLLFLLIRRVYRAVGYVWPGLVRRRENNRRAGRRLFLDEEAT